MVVLTLDEERNLARTLESVAAWAAHIFVVDSGSSDGTVAIATRLGAEVVTHTFESHAAQWAWALRTLPIATEWVLALDADQSVSSELADEIARKLVAWTSLTSYTGPDAPAGAYMSRRQIFRGRWIKHGGYYPKYLLKLFQREKVRLDETDLVDHHFQVEGPTAILAGDLVEDNRNEAQIAVWVAKHNRYAVLQAKEEEERDQRDRGSAPDPGSVACGGPYAPRRSLAGALCAPRRPGRLLGSPDERVRWRKRLWARLPLYVRPLGYFLYRYIIRLGFLDGKEGFVFHFMQAFWYRLLVDINRDELRQERPAGRSVAAEEHTFR